MTTLTYDHPRFGEFAEELQSRLTPAGRPGPSCDHSHAQTRPALRAIDADEEDSIAWLEDEAATATAK